MFAHPFPRGESSSSAPFGFVRKTFFLHQKVRRHLWTMHLIFHGKKHGHIPVALILFVFLLLPTIVIAGRKAAEERFIPSESVAPKESTAEATTAATPSAELGEKKMAQVDAKLPAGDLGKIENNAGYQFYYPYGLKVDTISTEPGSWSTVTLTSPDRSGSILVTVEGGSLADWLRKVAPIDRFSSSLGGKTAAKVLLPGVQTATAVESGGNVYIVTLKGGNDDQYWLEAYRTVTTTFSFASFLGSQEDARTRFGL
ncbi:MAG: hypothetical protein Q8R11_04305 [bacterium]|nr:hypothetical protein [bacterium]